MKRKIIFLGITVIILIIGIWIGWNVFSNKDVTPPPPKESEIFQPSAKEEVDLIINNGEETKGFKINFKKGMTAFDALKSKADELNLKTKTYDIGILIQAIGDKENGQEAKYWLYYINGQMPMVSVDKQEIKAGDKIEFKFEKSPF